LKIVPSHGSIELKFGCDGEVDTPSALHSQPG
jgi:hypothetical protein